MQAEMSDARLVERALVGESAAFDVLIQRFQRAVHAVAFAVTAEREAALDVLQESFIAAYRQLIALQEPEKFGAWVCGIARNRARVYLRERARRQAHEIPLAELEETAAADTPYDTLEGLREALSRLTVTQADVVTLFYMEGYTIRECASLLDVPEGTVKRRLHDARQRLRKELIEMVETKFTEFALPEDYHVVIDNTSRLLSNHTTLAWFHDRWVMVWQDGVRWGPERWACNQFTYWLAESPDGHTWSAPRRLEFAEVPYPDAHHFHLCQAMVHRGRLYLQSFIHDNGIDLYSSADLEQWTAHPRLCIPRAGRSCLFGDEQYLYLTYPSWVEYAQVQGDRVDLLRSADGGESWQWLRSPAWPDQGITDAAGLVAHGYLYLAWRGHARTPDTPPQQVSLIRSEDDGASWSAPVTVEPLTLTYGASWSLRLAAAGDTLLIAQEVWDEPGSGASEVWVAFSRDRGQSWTKKAVYPTGSLLDPAIAIAPDGAIMLAGSSHDAHGSHPWFMRSEVAG